MKKEIIARGAITALLTPLNKYGLNLNALEHLLREQINSGISGILLFGTTGEPLSLNKIEKRIIFHTAKEIISKKKPIICGISSPVTKICIEKAKILENSGADALMLITPYYYRVNERGMYMHFKTVCESTKLPVIIYNVPARTAYDLTANMPLLKRISELPNIIAIKNAQSDKEKSCNFTLESPLPVYSGCDENNFDILKSGGIGCISVASNIYPKSVSDICKLFFSGDIEKSFKLNKKLLFFYSLLSEEPNPAPVKFALAVKLAQNFGETDYLRLPLSKISANLQNKIINYMNNGGTLL